MKRNARMEIPMKLRIERVNKGLCPICGYKSRMDCMRRFFGPDNMYYEDRYIHVCDNCGRVTGQ